MGIDLRVLQFINEHIQNPVFDAAMPWITRLGNLGLLWIAVTVVLLCIKKYRRTGVVLAAALVFVTVLGELVLKPIVGRSRPFEGFLTIELLIQAPMGYSFPSGHALLGFTAATVLFLRDKRLGVAAGLVALLIAFSRLYLNVHYATDVAAGILLGILCGWLVTFVFQRLKYL